jgi:hypothetical protein
MSTLPPSLILALPREVEVAGNGEASRRLTIGRAASWLYRAQQEGYWRGMPTLAGKSDVWVTAFVAAHLRQIAPRPAPLAKARAYLAAELRPEGGWSYGGEVPSDADSTAWCLIALHRSRQLPQSARCQALDFLASHQTDQGTATYAAGSAIRQYIKANPSMSLAGWTAPHADVTVAALLAGVPSLRSRLGLAILSHLISRQSGAGFWDAYWWRGPFYTTVLILRAVDTAGYRLPRPQATRLLRALEREQLQHGGFGLGASMEADPFTTALALECYSRLAYIGGAEGRHAATQVLIEQQREDGGWMGDYVMRIPAPDVVDPRHVSGWSRGTGGGNSYVLDVNGVFATTLAAMALTIAQDGDSGLEDRPELMVSGEPTLDETIKIVSR